MSAIERIKDQSILHRQDDPLGGDLRFPPQKINLNRGGGQANLKTRVGNMSTRAKVGIGVGVVTLVGACGAGAAFLLPLNGEGPKSGNETQKDPAGESGPVNVDSPTGTAMPASSPTSTLGASQTVVAGGYQPEVYPTPTAASANDVWAGELPVNEYRSANSGPNVMNAVGASLSSAVNRYKFDPVSREDSLLTSLVNPFEAGEDFGPDPLTEPGLGQTDYDIAVYEYVGNLTNGSDWRTDIRVRDLAHLNGNNLRTMGIFGPAHDKDSMAAVAALGILFDADEGPGIDGDMTMFDAMNDPKIRPHLRQLQQSILNKFREKSLGPSDTEESRIEAGSADDTSHMLPKELRDGDEFTTCEVFRPAADSRQDQMQNIREVPHVSGGDGTFTEANLDDENLLMVWAMDIDGKWKIEIFTDRDFRDINPGSASGSQLITCGEGESEVPTETATLTATPTATVEYIITPNTPTLPVITVTRPAGTPIWAPTQPIQPSATPGGGSQTEVPTPGSTPAPEETKRPKNNGDNEGPKPTSPFND